jgi:hypothetical protein
MPETQAPLIYRLGLAARVYGWNSNSSHSSRHLPSNSCIRGISRHASCAAWFSQAPKERNFLGSSMLRTNTKETAPSALSNDHSMNVVHLSTNSSSLRALTDHSPEL